MAVCGSSDAEGVIYEGRIFAGPWTVEYRFAAPEKPGACLFLRDAHRRTMAGDFVVEG